MINEKENERKKEREREREERVCVCVYGLTPLWWSLTPESESMSTPILHGGTILRKSNLLNSPEQV